MPRTVTKVGKISRRAGLLASVVLAAAAPIASAAAQPAPSDQLLAGFQTPPAEVRPRVWWHWLNGNVTKEGIDKDLVWMKRVGIAGVQLFEETMSTPVIVDKRLAYMSPEWKEAFRFAVEKADGLGLDFTIAASPGWSETGGPWVTPQNAMKKLVWSETDVVGGRWFGGRLARPSDVSGPYGDLPGGREITSILAGGKPFTPPTLYGDVAVFAYRLPGAAAAPTPRVIADGHPLDAAALFDGSLTTGVEIPQSALKDGLVLDYGDRQTVRSATVFVERPAYGAARAPTPQLEASADGQAWRGVADLPLDAVPTTVSFPAVQARYFRVVFRQRPNAGGARSGPDVGVPGAARPGFGGASSAAAQPPIRIRELRLSGEARIDRFETKAGFALSPDYYALSRGADRAAQGARISQVIDLTARMAPGGALDWTPPAGRWRIVRLGFSLTGKSNHPVPPEARGLEVDKYDRGAVRDYMERYLGAYEEIVGARLVGAKGVRSVLNDSYEAGPANWTPRMLEQFRARRGYDPRPWLPTLTGAIVGSREQSDAFLYDYRRTLAELIASEHYGAVAEVAHEHGLKSYAEALEGGRPALGDDMAMRRYADVPVSALWAYPWGEAPATSAWADMKGAASVAHVYGRKVVAAESLTSTFAPWAYAPADLRKMLDYEFARGVNLPLFQTSVHVPIEGKLPGLTLSTVGQYLNRNDTWAELAKPWLDYVSRSSFMLQQGRDVADVAYFYGEEAPITALFASGAPADLPVRYGYDFVNADALADQVTVEGQELVAKSGARYRALYLGGTSRRMTLPTLRRIAALAEAGATIIGDAPESSPSLSDDPAEFRALASRLWSGGAVGKGRIIAGRDVEAALASLQLPPDFDYVKPQPDAELLFVHRRLADGDVYFVNNRKNRAEAIEARFRVTGKAPEIWRADSGAVEPVSYRVERGVTVVPLALAPEDSFFVVFRKPAAAAAATVAPPTLVNVAELQGGWDVVFQPGRGAPASLRLPALASLSQQADPGVKYFSGEATYAKTFDLPRGVRPGASLWLDLGAVGDVAEVRVNGQTVGGLWHAPYRLDIGKAVRAGGNQLEVRVANLWVNRLIGDAQPGATRKVTSTTTPTYLPTAPLRPSGLIGPVRLWVETTM